MIQIRNISKAYRTVNGWNQVLKDISVTFPSDRNVGVLGLNGSGKSTLLRLIGGVESPDRGDIIKDLRTSWPIGFSGGFQPLMTGRENTRFVSRIYGADLKHVESFVQDFAEVGAYYDMAVRTYSAGMRARLAFAVSMAVEFDCYLIDELTAVGDQRFRDKYHKAFMDRRSRSTVVMVSHQPATIREFCNMIAILFDGKISLYNSVQDGMNAYQEKISSVERTE